MTDQEKKDQEEAQSRRFAQELGALGPVRDEPPACWSWSIPEDLHERAAAHLTSFAPRTRARLGDPDELLAYVRLQLWHEERCALCGKKSGRLVDDHDYETGLMRGFLCRSCNTREGQSRDRSGCFADYRSRPPAVILGVRVPYLHPFTGENAVPLPTAAGDRWRDNAMRGVGL
jgi:hypothetical protein